MSLLFVVTTFPDAETARRIVRQLVEEERIACGTLLPGAESLYRWEGALETAHECLVLLKTTSEAYPALEARLKSVHPYEVPEIVAFSASGGLPAYLEWAARACRPHHEGEAG
ncbi:MAG TPA: divalent-cation tolerance protein CutA [Chthoniobacteraceae bacterium]|nr:divalent-cation tolerance protein CutA [Chthoniobacteraceae bacterium]